MLSLKICLDEKSTRVFIKQLEARFPGENEVLSAQVREIVKKVQVDGRKAVLNFRSTFEGVEIEKPLVWNVEKLSKKEKIDSSFSKCLEISISRVREFHKNQLQSGGFENAVELKKGCGTKLSPLTSVAVYAPGGKAFYPSSLVMAVVPAQVSGVGRIEVFTPYRSLENEAFVQTIHALGISRVHLFGGAQAVAAATFGWNSENKFEGLKRFDKIVGPGNSYVAAAKQMLNGRIGTDGYAGPSEIVVLSDGTSSPEWIAWDMLAQAEHDAEAAAILVTTCAREASSLQKVLADCLTILKAESEERYLVAKSSLEKWGGVIFCESENESLAIVNELCTEHLHIHTSKALEKEGLEFYTKRIESAGAIFLGKFTCESFGDYLAGPSHVLPTAGTAKFASPLGVYDFFKRSSLIQFTEQMASELSGPTNSFARRENLISHAISAQCRAGAKS